MTEEPKNTQSAGGVVLNRDGKVLVVNQRRGTLWTLPNGHIEMTDKTPLETAKREILKESGITDLEYVKDLGDYERFRISIDGVNEDKTERKKIYVFLFKTNEDFLKPIDNKIQEAKWVLKEEAAELLTHPNDKAFFRGIVDKI